MQLFKKMGFKLGSIDNCPPYLHVALYLYASLEVIQLFYFVVEFEYSANIVLNLDKLYIYMYCKL